MIKPKQQDPRDLWAGAIVVVLGALTSIHALSYPIGTASHMGPGYFPLVLGILLMIFGSAIIVSSNEPPTKQEKICARTIVMVTVSMVAFAALLAWSGLIPAVIAAVLLSGTASQDHDWWLSIKIAAALSLLSAVIFKYILGMQVHLF